MAGAGGTALREPRAEQPAVAQAAAPRRLRVLRRVPLPLRWLLAATLALSLIWAILLPAFQAPDENSHFGYVQSLAEDFRLPGDADRPLFSTEQARASSDANADQAAAVRDTKMEWDEGAYERWRAKGADLARDDGGGPNPASSNPPLYYLYEAVAYRVAGAGDLFDRLLATRIASLLWLLGTVAGVWLLIGEVFGRDRLLQLAGAAVAGLAPMPMFVSAAVSPDAMLYALWSLALWLGVRMLKRGLTVRSGAALAGVVGVACLVKATSYALLPGTAAAFATGLWRLRPLETRRALRLVGAGLGALAVTAGTWLIVARVLDREVSAQLSSATSTSGFNLRELFSYLWQFYLPNLPSQTPYPTVAETIPVYDIWIKTGWAAFGWTEVTFPGVVYVLLTLVTVGVGGIAVVAVWRNRRGIDLGVAGFLALVALTLLAGLHWTEYKEIEAGSANFNQGRYLFPLLGLAGLAVAQAVRVLAPARRGVAVAGVLGALFALQVASLALVAARFYA